MSGDAVLVVADTLRKAIAKAEDDAYLHGAWNSKPELDPDEVAAAVVDALGGLERETRFRYTHLGTGRWTILESTDVQVARKIAGTTHELTEVSRWVSGWVREPAEEGKR